MLTLLCVQSKVRKEAALSAVDEQRRNKEATEAENAANIAKMAEHEAAVGFDSCNIKRIVICWLIDHEPGFAHDCAAAAPQEQCLQKGKLACPCRCGNSGSGSESCMPLMRRRSV